jgi:hypothetical protein
MTGPWPRATAFLRTIVVSPAVRAGFRSALSHTHYSLLRTVEAAWVLGCLDGSCSANDLREFFGHWPSSTSA